MAAALRTIANTMSTIALGDFLLSFAPFNDTGSGSVTTLYGIKNCDTVKKARTWLDERGISYRFHDFRLDGLSADQVTAWMDELGLDTLVNKRSTTWKELDEATRAGFDNRSAVALIVQHPTLIKRPLLDTGKTRQVGFNATDWQTLF